MSVLAITVNALWRLIALSIKHRNRPRLIARNASIGKNGPKPGMGKTTVVEELRQQEHLAASEMLASAPSSARYLNAVAARLAESVKPCREDNLELAAIEVRKAYA